MLPELIFTIGIPGSGKSVWVNKIKGMGYYVVCPDDIRLHYLQDISDQSQNAYIWKIAKDRTIDLLVNKKNVLLDATNVDTTYRKDFIQGLPPCILKAKIFYVSPEEALNRIQKDVASGKVRANVPENVIYAMYDKFIHSLKVLELEGFNLIS